MTGVSRLSALEERLVDAVASDVPFVASETVPASASPEHTVRAEVIRDLVLGRLVAQPGPGGVRIQGVYVSGQLDLSDVQSPTRLQLTRCRLPHPLVLVDAQLRQLVLSGSYLAGVEADRLRVDNNVMLQDVVVSAVGGQCAVRLLGAQVGGQLSLTGATLAAPANCALHADGLRVDGALLLRDGFHARGFGERGAVRLIGAQVGADLDCDGARIVGEGGPGLNAERVQVGGNLYLRGAAVRGGAPGAVVLVGGRVSGQLSCSGCDVRAARGAAVVADAVTVEGDVFANDGFRAEGPGGGVRLLGGRIGGHLQCAGGAAAGGGPGSPALDLRFASIGNALHLPAGFAATVELDGLQYPAVPVGMGRDEWLALLRGGTGSYAAQPYQQLAAAYRAAGRTHDARAVLVAQQRDLLRRGDLRGPARLWHRMFGLLLGYGYQSWRALVALAATLAVATVLVLTLAGTTHAVHRPADDGRPPARCSTVDQVGLAVDLTVPLVDTGSRQRCDLVASRPEEEPLVVLGWVLQGLGWAFATLFVAGYTGLIRNA